MNTDALHVSTRRLTSFQHGKDPTVHTSMHYGSFTLHKLHFRYMAIFIHDSFKLNVTTVERQARMKWTWVTMDAMRCGCHVELCRCDAMWWCHVSKWSTNHWQQCGNTEINNNRIQLSKRDKTQQEQKRKTKPQAAFCLGPRESSFEVVCFRDWSGGGGWGVGGVDKFAKTFCCALCLYL